MLILGPRVSQGQGYWHKNVLVLKVGRGEFWNLENISESTVNEVFVYLLVCVVDLFTLVNRITYLYVLLHASFVTLKRGSEYIRKSIILRLSTVNHFIFTWFLLCENPLCDIFHRFTNSRWRVFIYVCIYVPDL